MEPVRVLIKITKESSFYDTAWVGYDNIISRAIAMLRMKQNTLRLLTLCTRVRSDENSTELIDRLTCGFLFHSISFH